MVERGQVKKTLRAVLFCILLIVYYLMYMHTAVDQYYEEKTTMAQTRINTNAGIPMRIVAVHHDHPAVDPRPTKQVTPVQPMAAIKRSTD